MNFAHLFLTSLQHTKIINLIAIILINTSLWYSKLCNYIALVVLTLKEEVVLGSIIPDEWLSMFKSLESSQQPQGLGLW